MSASSGRGPRLSRRAGIAASLALVALAVLLAVLGGSGGGSGAVVEETPPRIVDAGALAELEGDLGHPVYWAGERPPGRLEISVEADGSAFVRYLPPGVSAGDSRADFLTVGTYAVAGAQHALRRSARAAGVSLEGVARGGVVFTDPSARGSAYLAYPGSDLQIEVYDPRPGRALDLIRAGAILPAGEAE